MHIRRHRYFLNIWLLQKVFLIYVRDSFSIASVHAVPFYICETFFLSLLFIRYRSKFETELLERFPTSVVSSPRGKHSAYSYENKYHTLACWPPLNIVVSSKWSGKLLTNSSNFRTAITVSLSSSLPEKKPFNYISVLNCIYVHWAV
jgi:hypothetical protein